MTHQTNASAITTDLKMGAGLTGAIGVLFILALLFYPHRPHELVVLTCVIAAGLLLPGTCLIIWLIRDHEMSTGEERPTVEYAALALNYCWWCLALVLAVFIGAEGFWRVVKTYPDFAVGLGSAAALLGLGFIGVRRPRQGTRDLVKEVVREEMRSGGPLALVPVVKNLKPSAPQLPSFQVTFPDVRRLIVHQAARLLAYKNSPLLKDDSFSADIDINRRTAAIFSGHSFYQTKEFLFWRLHMLLIGSAGEQVLLGATSTASFDDFNEFTKVADDYLQLAYGAPVRDAVSPAELNMRQHRYDTLRKQVFQRCLAAVQENREVLVSLVAKLESQPVVGVHDLRPYLDRAALPGGFPVATDDVAAALASLEIGPAQLTTDKAETSGQQPALPSSVSPQNGNGGAQLTARESKTDSEPGGKTPQATRGSARQAVGASVQTETPQLAAAPEGTVH